jgi:hypothetical protein
MFHRGTVFVRRETLAYNPNDHAHSVMDSSYLCSRHHVESFAADPFQHPAECPKLAQPITGISLLMETLVATLSLVVMIIWLARESLKSLSIFNISSYSCHDYR